MVTWTQMYMPMGGLGLSALVALIPIIFFFVALAVLRLKGHVAGAITLISVSYTHLTLPTTERV